MDIGIVEKLEKREEEMGEEEDEDEEMDEEMDEDMDEEGERMAGAIEEETDVKVEGMGGAVEEEMDGEGEGMVDEVEIWVEINEEVIDKEEDEEEKIKAEKEKVEEYDEKLILSDEEWREKLSPQAYHVMREKGTDPPFTGDHIARKHPGIYTCASCGKELFASETKYDSGSGWPSFWAPISGDNIDTKTDGSFFIKRTEVLCRKCGGHLGHVFHDGPEPTGFRYCVNSSALKFVDE